MYCRKYTEIVSHDLCREVYPYLGESTICCSTVHDYTERCHSVFYLPMKGLVYLRF